MAVIDLEQYAEKAELRRTFSKHEKYRVRTMDGRIRREVAGTYITYSLSLGNVNQEKYDELIDLLLSDDEYATVIMPHTRIAGKNVVFDAIYEDITDELITEELDGTRCWDNLTIQLVMAEPAAEVMASQ